jgi:putative tryptophan/tyrosine transport system substrate-binding protein
MATSSSTRRLGSAAVWPLAARAQQPTNPTIGFLASRPDFCSSYSVAAFLRGLKESGYLEGHNVAIEYRSAENRVDALPALARELVKRTALIVTYDTAAALAAKAATTTIPIVFSVGADPIKIGLVTSLARPGGNITGVSFLGNALGSKRLELLHDLVPSAATFGFLVDTSNPNAKSETEDMRSAADALGHKLVVVSAESAIEIDAAFAKLVAQRVDALAVAAHVFFGGRSQQLAELALRHRLPTIFAFRDSAAAGGLISYGGSGTEAFRQQGIYAARILKGEKPADLPVQQVTRFEMVLNLKTAKTLGVTVPQSILLSADEVIE